MSSFAQTTTTVWDDNRNLGVSLTRKNTIDKILEG